MKAFLLQHKVSFVIASIFFALVVGATIITVIDSQKEAKPIPTPTQSSNPIQNTTAQNGIAISPDNSTILSPNSRPEFIITLPSSIQMSEIKITGTALDIPPQGLAKPISISQKPISNQSIRITFAEAIAPSSEYAVSITNINTSTLLFATRYISADIKPTRVPTNNLSLIPYLPHETHTYKLSYDKSRNVYVFSFLFDEKSNDTLDTQFAKAKQDAIIFIQSKGIDINSIVINWNYH